MQRSHRLVRTGRPEDPRGHPYLDDGRPWSGQESAAEAGLCHCSQAGRPGGCWGGNLIISHMLHGAGLFTYIYPKNHPNVGI